MASHSLTAYSGYSCADPECRIAKVSNLATFATLYSDTMYIPNYFSSTGHKDNKTVGWDFWSDLMVINNLRPAIESGHINLIDLNICRECTKPYFESVDTQFPKALIDELEDYYIKESQISVKRDGVFGKKMFDIKSSLYEHGSTLIVGNSKVNSFKLGNLSKKQIKESGFIAYRLKQSLADMRYHSITSNLIGTSFITDNIAQENLLYKHHQDNERMKINEALKKLFFETPIFKDIPLEKIVEIRKEETESFDDYRRTLSTSLKTLIAKNDEITSKIVEEYYFDIIKPEVDKLDRKIRLTKKTLMKKAWRNFSIMGVCLGTGLALGLPKSALAAFGTVTYAGQTIASIFEAREQSPEMQLNNFYFIWKINQEKSAELNK